jgi:hypothetical protein
MKREGGKMRRKLRVAKVANLGLFVTLSIGIVTAGMAVALQAGAETTNPAAPANTGPWGEVRPDGSVDISLVPDFILTEDRSGKTVGYVAKADLYSQPVPGAEAVSPLNPPADAPIPVYSLDDKATVVGHQYPAKGFVPLGTNSNDVPGIPVTAGPMRP